MPRAHFSLPTIAHVAGILFDHWTAHHDEAVDARWSEADDDDERNNGPDLDADADTYIDVRLWATSSDRIGHPMCWDVEFGSSDYDQIHGDICSSTSLDLASEPDRKVCEREAREMLSDLRSQRAEYWQYINGVK